MLAGLPRLGPKLNLVGAMWEEFYKRENWPGYILSPFGVVHCCPSLWLCSRLLDWSPMVLVMYSHLTPCVVEYYHLYSFRCLYHLLLGGWCLVCCLSVPLFDLLSWTNLDILFGVRCCLVSFRFRLVFWRYVRTSSLLPCRVSL